MLKAFMRDMRPWTIVAYVPGQGWVRHPEDPRAFTLSQAMRRAIWASAASQFRIGWEATHRSSMFMDPERGNRAQSVDQLPRMRQPTATSPSPSS